MTTWKTFFLFLSFTACLPAQRMAPTYPSFQAFFDSCPQNDPYYAVIRRDFKIMRDHVEAGDIPCTEPFSKMSATPGSEELNILQALRFAYYMDMGQSGYLPWTPLRLYDWFKSRIAGFEIDTALDPGLIAAFCCSVINGRNYMIQSTISVQPNQLYDELPEGIAAQVALIAHETRHSEGNKYGHVGCCGIQNGCDQTYDEKNLSAYGVQYYLMKQWLTGGINLGYSCDAAQRSQLANSFMNFANAYPQRFCDIKPPTLILPSNPGGACISACSLTSAPTDVLQIPAAGGTSSIGVSASTSSCAWTADSADSWLFATSGQNSIGSGPAIFGGVPNQTDQPRIGTLMAGGSTFAVTQPGCSTCTPAVSITSVVSGAAFATAVTSGSWVTIYGTNLSGTTRQWAAADFSGNKLPTSLDGVSVRIDGQPAAVYFVSPTQLNVQMPDSGATGPVNVQVANGMGAATAMVTLQTFAPAFFTFARKYVAAVHLDGTLVGPAGILGASVATRPANPGETIAIFGTGFGDTNPPRGAGVVYTGAAPLAFPNQLSLKIGGKAAPVSFAGLTAAGLYQLNVLVPSLPDGDSEAIASLGTVLSPSNIFLTVQNP